MQKDKVKLIPKVGKIYNAFDDGKVSYTRMFKVKITKKLNLKKDKVSKRLLKLIDYEIKNCWWLYDTKQTIIYRGKALNDDGSYNKSYGYQWFLKMKDSGLYKQGRTTIMTLSRGGWFSIDSGMGGAELDVDGNMLRKLDEIFKED